MAYKLVNELEQAIILQLKKSDMKNKELFDYLWERGLFQISDSAEAKNKRVKFMKIATFQRHLQANFTSKYGTDIIFMPRGATIMNQITSLPERYTSIMLINTDVTS